MICRVAGLIGVMALLFASPVALAAQECPASVNPTAAQGWEAYRANDITAARTAFEEVLGDCPSHVGARTGLGYVALRQDALEEARELWLSVVRDDAANVDAIVGLGLIAWREGDVEEVGRRMRTALAIVPDHPTANEYVDRLRAAPDPEANRAWLDGNTGRAFELYSARLESNPADAVALHRMALMTGWDGDYGGSIRLFNSLLAIEPNNLEARVGRARVLAWSGDVRGAIEGVRVALDLDPTYRPAIEAEAEFLARAGEVEASVAAYDALLALAPGDASLRRAQARVLVRAESTDRAKAAYDSILASEPDDVETRLARGRLLTFSNQPEDGLEDYRAILERDPSHVEARQGAARALTWAGRLVEGEEAWREVTRAVPDDPAPLIGLAQNLRWQGRHKAALEALDRATAIDPTNGDAREERRWVGASLSPRVAPSLILESDSDDNDMMTALLQAPWNANPTLGFRLTAYQRDLEQGRLDRSAWGGQLTTTVALEPGWLVSGGVGTSDVDRPLASQVPEGTDLDPEQTISLSASVASPARYPWGGSLIVRREALDATAALVSQVVTTEKVGLTGRWTPTRRIQVDGDVGATWYDGRVPNRRMDGRLSVSRDIGASWTLGWTARAFGFREDVNDGYFDPEFYGLLEAMGRWQRGFGRWSATLEAAPGAQRLGWGGPVSGTVRATTRLAWQFRPGREIAASAGFSSTGLQSFSTDASYEYRAFVLSGKWVF